MQVAYRQIRADYDQNTLVVYQAYRDAIAEAALAAQKFVPPFSYQRMTWIKPSFLWMMERCGWAEKKDQENVLAVRIRRDCFEKALSQAVLSSSRPGQDSHQWKAALRQSPVRVQWDPERSLRGAKLEYRSIQVGIARELSQAYATEWVVEIVDYTPLARKLQNLRRLGKWDEAARHLPLERPYLLPDQIARRLAMV